MDVSPANGILGEMNVLREKKKILNFELKNRIIFLVVSFLLLAPFCVRAQQAEEDKPKLVIPDSLRATYKYTDALKALTIHNDTTKGVALLKEAVEIDSTYAPAHYELASYYLENNPQHATTHARKAYEQDTTSRWYMGLYGQVMAISGNFDGALPIFQKLIKVDRNNPDHYRILSILYQQRKQPYSAIATLDSAEVRFGKINALTNMKRHLLIRTNQMDRAINEAKQAVEEAPYEVDNVISLGHTYASAGRDSLAKVTLEQAIKMDSTSIDALTTYIDFCSQRHDMQGYLSTLKMLFAQKPYPLDRKVDIVKKLTSDHTFYGNNFYQIGSLLQTLMIHHPEQKSVIDLYGDHLLACGDFESALTHFKEQLDNDPPQMDYYMAVIDIEDYLQHPDSVDYYVQRAMDRFPGDPKLIIRKANRQYMKGNLTGAIDSFHEAMTLTESDSLKGELWGYVGDTFHAIAERRAEQLKAKIKRDTSAYPVKMKPHKAMEECFAAYEKALALYPDNAMVLNNYAYFLSELDMELEKALTMSTRAIMLSENNSTYLDTHAWVLYKIGRYDEARNVMRKALMLDRSGSEALLMHYGDILYALKDKFMAETYWKKALEAGADPREVERRMAMLKETSDEK